MSVLSIKGPIRKKSGNLLNDPRTNVTIDFLRPIFPLKNKGIIHFMFLNTSKLYTQYMIIPFVTKKSRGHSLHKYIFSHSHIHCLYLIFFF